MIWAVFLQTLYKAEVPNLNIWVTTTGLTYQFFKIEENENDSEKSAVYMKDENAKCEWHRVDMILKDASIKRENIITENNITQGDVRYYLGHCPQGIFNVKTFTKITVKEVYPGIDWVLYTAQGTLKHDFIVHPNADPKQVKLIYEGSGNISAKENSIHFSNKLGELSEGKLLCYQGQQSALVKSHYTVKKNNTPTYAGAGNFPVTDRATLSKPKRKNVYSYEIGIETQNYNKNQVLIIDPQLVWATFFGGSGLDGPLAAETDSQGFLYITGYSQDFGFPLQNFGGAFNQGHLGGWAAFNTWIMRFSNTGVLTWSTFYGAGTQTFPGGITVDGADNVYITGYTNDPALPTVNWIGAYNQNIFGGNYDTYIIRFNNTGALTWATYYGGADYEFGADIAIDGLNNIYVTGYAVNGFPLVNLVGGYNQSFTAGGTEAFLIRFTNTGVCDWATCYGGTKDERAHSIAIDGLNNVYVTGYTYSTDAFLQAWGTAYFQNYGGGAASPFAGGDTFILRLDPSGTLTWATDYGGTNQDFGGTIAIDPNNNIYILGNTLSTNLPIVNWSGAYNQATNGGNWDVFILRFDVTGNLTWATYYGDGGNNPEQFITLDNVAIDKCGNIFISFETYSATGIYTAGNSACGNYSNKTINNPKDIFLVKFNSQGVVLWANYFGGSSTDFREALAVDNAGNLFVTGEWGQGANPSTYPLTNPGGGAYYNPSNPGNENGYVAKFVPITPGNTQSQTNSTICSPCNGGATVNLTCSDPPYSYVWSNGSSTLNSSIASNTATGLCPGTYTVTATSNCNQTQIASFIITGTTCDVCSLSGQFTKGTSNCTGCGCQEWILVNAVGGTPPYTYQWSAFGGYDKRYKNKLCPDNYTVKVTDKNGCSVDVNITAP